MNIKNYTFDTWTELNKFVDENKSKFIGKTIDQYYCEYGDYLMSTDGPIVLVIGNLYIMIYYMILSSIEISIFDKETFEKKIMKEEFINISNDFPLYHKSISNIYIDRFSEKFEINPATRENRLNRGDYFSTIKIGMNNSKNFCICAEDSANDGYCKTWIENGYKIFLVSR